MKFDIMMIDPPWKKRKGGKRSVRPKQNKSFDYETLDTKTIFELMDNEVFPLCEKQHTIFLWTIEDYLIESDNYMTERGYRRHARLIWDKMNGVAPAFTVRYCHEYLIWYYRPKMMPISKNFRGKFSTVFSEKSRQHSRKPDIAYKMVDDLYPDYRKMDVFSREKRDGWEQFGNQIDHFS